MGIPSTDFIHTFLVFLTGMIFCSNLGNPRLTWFYSEGIGFKKIVVFVNWRKAGLSKSARIVLSKSIFYVKSNRFFFSFKNIKLGDHFWLKNNLWIQFLKHLLLLTKIIPTFCSTALKIHFPWRQFISFWLKQANVGFPRSKQKNKLISMAIDLTWINVALEILI